MKMSDLAEEAAVGVVAHNKKMAKDPRYITSMTVDVKPGETQRQAKKFGNKLDKKGIPPVINSKGNANVLFNLGLAEGYKLQLERDKKMLVLNITNTETGRRTEVRGKPDYESGGYDPDDKLHQLLDALGKSVDMSQLMNGEPVGINPKHPHGAKAKASTDVAYNERFTSMELALMEGGHSIEEETPKEPGAIYKALEEKWSQKYKRSINCNNPKGFSQKAHCQGRKKTNEAFIKPNFDYEWEEANRYPEFQKIGKDAWIELAKKGKAVTIKSAKDINNTDAADPNSFKSLDKNKQARALAQLKSGDVEMPIVAVYSDGYKELVGGNTRLTAMMAQNGKATVWQFAVPDEVAELAENFADDKKKGKVYNESTDLNSLRKFVRSQREAPDQVLYQMMMAPDTYGHSASNFVRSWYERTKEENGLNDVDSALEIMVDELGLNENFADGKKKGKSRPGRVKRAGASCNGSVTALRKRAKNASGEKARMYHWCANMKSGRKKK